MDFSEKIELLGQAFAFGKTDELAVYLNENCTYHSDYAHKHLTSAAQIIKSMNSVAEAVKRNNEEGKNSTYTYRTIKLAEVFKEGVSLDDLYGDSFFDVCEEGVLLYQFGDPNPVAVVYAKSNPGGFFTEINLSRNKKWFAVTFYGDDGLEDSFKDIPYTVKPMSSHDRQVQEMRSVWTHQDYDYENLDDSEVYIWRQADKFIKDWLDDNGYYVRESQVFDDCIGYRCNRNNYAYTVFMYAYGQEKTAQLDGDYCKKLLDYDLSDHSTVLVVYLNVKRRKNGESFTYTVCNYAGDEDRSIELWRVIEVAGKPILEYYPRKEMMDATDELMYAFNRSSMDVYDCIVCAQNPSFSGYNSNGSYMNAWFYSSLLNLHEKYGNMKIGYVRFNDVVYSSVPYLEGYGYFTFRVDNRTNRIIEVSSFPFEDGDRPIAEFIRTDEQEDSNLYDFIPAIVSVKALPSAATERFAIQAEFDNGECRKYVLPIDSEGEAEETVKYLGYAFSDSVWESARVVEKRPAGVDGYPECGQAIAFDNGFFISAMLCYIDGVRYSEPVVCNEPVYDDGTYKLTRKWSWKVNSVYVDEETGLLKTLLSGQAFNWYGKSTFAQPDGSARCSLNFDYISDFKEGLALVMKRGIGYGYIDKDLHFVIPMQYDNAEDFQNGRARVKRGDSWMFIDKTGEETPIQPSDFSERYQQICDFSEGLCRVSTLRLSFMDLAYQSDYEEIAGTWGYVDERGNEVIAPQYIYANDFSGGIAIVCKGKWTIDKKWDNKYNKGRYWTEEELWGGIDRNGNEVIPCKFDEIKFFWDTDGVYMAHFGGWKEGKWGVIDNHGNWLVEPIFEDIDYEYHDGLFAFYPEDKWSGDDVPLGIYDLKQKRVLFEPQFYDVSFRDDDYIEVEAYDEELGRRVEKLIDRNGKEKFHSIYSSIHTWRVPYEVIIRDETGDHHGLIDEDGNVILPCKYDAAWGGVSYENRRIVFVENGKQGIRDFDDNLIVEPIYQEIHGLQNPLLTVRVGDKDHYKEGLITRDGKEILPAEYERITWYNGNCIICCNDGKGYTEMLVFESK